MSNLIYFNNTNEQQTTDDDKLSEVLMSVVLEPVITILENYAQEFSKEFDDVPPHHIKGLILALICRAADIEAPTEYNYIKNILSPAQVRQLAEICAEIYTTVESVSEDFEIPVYILVLTLIQYYL